MKYFSTFSGVEGIGQGLPKSWKCVGFSEFDKYASEVLNYHYPKVKNYGDITKIKWEEVADFDLLTGGSPCQDFSIAGKRRGLAGSKSSLAWEFIRGLRSKRPRYFIWENVKGVMSSRGGWDFANLLIAFSESGYSLWWQILNAKDFGVPQNRERIFVVGFREESPKEIFFKRDNGKEANEVQGQYSNTLTTRYDKSQTTGTYIIENKLDAKIKVINKGESQHYRVYDTGGVAPTLQSQSGFSSQKHPFVISHFPRNGNPKKGGTGVLKSDKFSFTVDTSPHYLEKENKIRKLMPVECERLMSWQDDWTKFGMTEKGKIEEISDSQRYKMCGNGVVSEVVKKIVEELF